MKKDKQDQDQLDRIISNLVDIKIVLTTSLGIIVGILIVFGLHLIGKVI